MRAVRHTEHGIEVVDVDGSDVDASDADGSDAVAVRVRSSGICGSDLHLLEWGPSPITLGHEVAGTLPDGTPVALWPSMPCGVCDRCSIGQVAQCRTGLAAGYGVGRDGGMAESMLVAERNLIALPDGLRVEDGALVEPMACAVHALRRVGVGRDDRIAIVGGGAIGLCAAAAAHSLDATVDVEARHPAQRAAAQQFGVGVEASGEYDVVVDAAGTSSAMRRCLDLVRPGGTIAVVATHWSPVELPAFFTTKEPTFVAATGHGRLDEVHDMDVAARVLADRPEVAAAIITHRLPLDQAAVAFALAADRAAGAIKVVLEP